MTWTNATGIDVKAELKVYNGGSDPRVTCQSAGCFEGGWDSRNQFSTMYLVYPYDAPGIMDVTNDQNLAGCGRRRGVHGGQRRIDPGFVWC